MENVFLNELLRKKYLVLNYDNQSPIQNNDVLIGAILNSFASLGYSLNNQSIEILKHLTDQKLKSFYKNSYHLLEEFTDANVNHRVFYRNFPFIENISQEELNLRALLHYFTATSDNYGFTNEDLPDLVREKMIINENNNYLTIINPKQANEIIIKQTINLFEQKVAIENNMHEFCYASIKKFHDLIKPTIIPFKENLAIYVMALLRDTPKENPYINFTKENLSFVKTATDLLRIYVILSTNSPCLIGKIKFISFPRRIRKIFIEILNDLALNNPYLIEDLARHEFLWKKAFEYLHIGEYYEKYPTICQIANDFRNDNYVTYYSKLEKAKNNQDELLNLLCQRPSEFARRLDYLLRNDNFDEDKTINAFSKVAIKVSSTVLLELYNYFLNRDQVTFERIFCFNSENGSKYFYTDDLRAFLPADIIDKALNIIKETLKEKYASYPKIENVYLDENLKKYALPSNNRNTSRQKQTLTTGSRISLANDNENAPFLRFFTHWKNTNYRSSDSEYDRVDIDLSLELFDESFKKCTSVSWHNIKGGHKFEIYHSGDIVTAPNGASEFIDCNYNLAKKYYRYAIVVNSIYTCQDFASVPECFSGVMFLNEKDRKSEIYQPSKVKYKFDLVQKGSDQNIAYLIDLENLEMIWLDIPLNFYSSFGVVASKNVTIRHILPRYLEKRINLYDFIKLHEKHLTFVNDKNDAKYLISDDENADLSPSDGEIIASKWL